MSDFIDLLRFLGPVSAAFFVGMIVATLAAVLSGTLTLMIPAMLFGLVCLATMRGYK